MEIFLVKKVPCLNVFLLSSFSYNGMWQPSIHLAMFCILVMSQNFSIKLCNYSPLGVWIYIEK